jgi:hypothetical protein
MASSRRFAAALGRDRSTVSRVIAPNGGLEHTQGWERHQREAKAWREGRDAVAREAPERCARRQAVAGQGASRPRPGEPRPTPPSTRGGRCRGRGSTACPPCRWSTSTTCPHERRRRARRRPPQRGGVPVADRAGRHVDARAGRPHPEPRAAHGDIARGREGGTAQARPSDGRRASPPGRASPQRATTSGVMVRQTHPAGGKRTCHRRRPRDGMAGEGYPPFCSL